MSQDSGSVCSLSGFQCLALGDSEVTSSLGCGGGAFQKSVCPSEPALRCCSHPLVSSDFQYLHNDKRLLHGDIKSSNVVIKGDFESIKICDVGVSLPLDDNMRGRSHW